MKQMYKKMRLRDKLKIETPYQIIAKEFEVSAKFVGMIARGERVPTRGKGLQIKQRIEEMISEAEK